MTTLVMRVAVELLCFVDGWLAVVAQWIDRRLSAEGTS